MKKPELDCIVIVDGNHDNNSDAVLIAKHLGWDVPNTDVLHVDAGNLGQWFNANCARKRVRLPDDWTNPPASWISCLVVHPRYMIEGVDPRSLGGWSEEPVTNDPELNRFTTEEDAENAVLQLVESGYDRSELRIVEA